MWVFFFLFFCVLFQEMRHINFLLGAQARVFFLCGGQKVYVEKVYVLFLSPT